MRNRSVLRRQSSDHSSGNRASTVSLRYSCNPGTGNKALNIVVTRPESRPLFSANTQACPSNSIRLDPPIAAEPTLLKLEGPLAFRALYTARAAGRTWQSKTTTTQRWPRRMPVQRVAFSSLLIATEFSPRPMHSSAGYPSWNSVWPRVHSAKGHGALPTLRPSGTRLQWWVVARVS